MTTDAQILANRRNALKSTGPRSTTGKAAISQNAVKHGLLARHAVISSESQADFDQHRAQILAELSPATPMESVLADRVVNLTWRLKRAARIQNQTIDALDERHNAPNPLAKLAKSLGQHSAAASKLPLGRLAIKDFSNDRVLEKLLMYERRIEQSLYKTLLEFQRLNLIRNLNTTAPETEFNSFLQNKPNSQAAEKT